MSPMAVEDTSTSSYLWHSLLKGRDIVRMKAVGRVGDDRSIDIWKDKWVAKLPDCYPSFEGTQRPTLMQVSTLINFESRMWNEQLLMEIFQPHEVSVIMNIPLS